MHAWLFVLAVLAILQGVTQVASTVEQTSQRPSSPAVSFIQTITSSSSSRRSSSSDTSDNVSTHSDSGVAQSEPTVDEDSVAEDGPIGGELRVQLEQDEVVEANSDSSSSSSSNSDSNSGSSDSNSHSKPDPATLVEIEKSLLSLFGFPKRPKIDRSKVVIPEAMKQLYAQIMGHELDDSVNVPKPGLNTRNANTVRSFTHEGKNRDQYLNNRTSSSSSSS